MSVVEIDWRPDNRKLRQFGLVFMIGFGLIGFVAAWRLGLFAGSGHVAVPVVLWAVALGAGLCGLVCPGCLRLPYLVWMGAAWPLGWLGSHLALGVIYYLVLTPMAWVFRRIGRDAMCRQFDPTAKTYWVRREPADSSKRYLRQF